MKPYSLLILSVTAVLGLRALAQAPTATTLNVSGLGGAVTSVAMGNPVTLTAAVTSAGANVTLGTVNFCDSAINANCNQLAVVGTAQLTPSGKARIVVRLGIGSHALKAFFAGTIVNSQSASAAANLTVTGKYASATSIASASGAGGYDLTATVSAFGPSSLMAPTGTVSFADASNSNIVIATADIASGTVNKALSFNNSSNPNLLSNPSSSQGFGLPMASTVVGDCFELRFSTIVIDFQRRQHSTESDSYNPDGLKHYVGNAPRWADRRGNRYPVAGSDILAAWLARDLHA